MYLLKSISIKTVFVNSYPQLATYYIWYVLELV